MDVKQSAFYISPSLRPREINQKNSQTHQRKSKVHNLSGLQILFIRMQTFEQYSLTICERYIFVFFLNFLPTARNALQRTQQNVPTREELSKTF